MALGVRNREKVKLGIQLEDRDIGGRENCDLENARLLIHQETKRTAWRITRIFKRTVQKTVRLEKREKYARRVRRTENQRVKPPRHSRPREQSNLTRGIAGVERSWGGDPVWEGRAPPPTRGSLALPKDDVLVNHFAKPYHKARTAGQKKGWSWSGGEGRRVGVPRVNGVGKRLVTPLYDKKL